MTTATVKPEGGRSHRALDLKSRPKNRAVEAVTRDTRVSAHADGVVNMAIYPPSVQPGTIASQ